MSLIRKADLEKEAISPFNSAWMYGKNPTFFRQVLYTDGSCYVYPITNVAYALDCECKPDWDLVCYEFVDKDEDCPPEMNEGCERISDYNDRWCGRGWRLFDAPPTEEELALPWDDRYPPYDPFKA